MKLPAPLTALGILSLFILCSSHISLAEEGLKKVHEEANKKFRSDVGTFYQENDFTPVWYSGDHLTSCGQVAIDVLKNSAEEGLNPKEYLQGLEDGDSYHKELMLTDRFLQYIDHLRAGRVEPTHISKHIKIKSLPVHPVQLLKEALHSQGCEKLKNLAPEGPQYQSLKALLKVYRALAVGHPNLPKISTKKKLKEGDSDDDVIVVRKLLALYGDLPKEAGANESKKFDAALKGGIKKFQERHTLEPDGVLGEKTREILNWSLKKQINKIIINMERLRWLPDHLEERYIIVNVAGYEVKAMEGNKEAIVTPAIVGKPSTRTPLFFASVKSVIINPSWNVPPGIMARDKLPKLRRDPGYAHRAGFSVTDSSGHRVDPSTVDWATEGRYYRLHQGPGAKNALGRVKIDIDNPYIIYLHDTPEKHLFTKRSRALSNGCIRLQKPREIASWILKDTSNGNLDAIGRLIAKGRTQTIKMDDHIPVYFLYMTVWKDEGGIIHFSDDPYHMDEGLVEFLKL
jgi:murein L,D-transpeptidase YcbB/YkuD